MAETSYASCGDLSLAYQVFGDGPIELVFVGPFVSHVELFWAMPEFKAFFEQLATFCRVAIFDKAGVGMSDPVPKVRTLDDRADEIEAVMDAVGFEKAAVFGMSEGGTASVVVRGQTTGANAGVDPLRHLPVHGKSGGTTSIATRPRCGRALAPPVRIEVVGVHAVDRADRPPAKSGPRHPLWVGHR